MPPIADQMNIAMRMALTIVLKSLLWYLKSSLSSSSRVNGAPCAAGCDCVGVLPSFGASSASCVSSSLVEDAAVFLFLTYHNRKDLESERKGIKGMCHACGLCLLGFD